MVVEAMVAEAMVVEVSALGLLTQTGCPKSQPLVLANRRLTPWRSSTLNLQDVFGQDPMENLDTSKPEFYINDTSMTPTR
mmetsp:Transcript_59811/g.104329  ORF Transcript_59811/g.104329 Transcript_59811/m.104329 type:complete len:80 (+) Transcript_59811:1146-1385(+)